MNDSADLIRRRVGCTSPIRLSALALLALILFLPTATEAAAQEPRALWNGCPTGSGAGQCFIPRGIATDSASGHVFIADQENSRINEFTAWGEFVKAWGWGVADGSAELQGCGPGATPPTESCQKGASGPGAGQLLHPMGIAIDSAGDLYTVDFSNNRVQKFDSEGNFILMFGGGVNKTKVDAAAPEAERNLCPVDPGDVCQAGVKGVGQGQFGAWRVGSFIAVAPGDEVHVGDAGRIQEFDAEGQYVSELSGGLLAGETIFALAADPAGDLYAAFFKSIQQGGEGKAGVVRLSGGAQTACLDVADPRALASDASGDVHVVDGNTGVGEKLQVHRFASGCPEDPELSFAPTGFEVSTGIATNTVTEAGGVGLYLSNFRDSSSFVRAYYPPPDKWLPPERAPRIEDQYAVSVLPESAVVRAAINPLFWADTSYYVEYGTGKCSEGGCTEKALFPGVGLDAGVVEDPITTKGVFLDGLQAGTTYHYRFVAESEGGGPVFGIDPDGEGAGKASPAEGLEGTFTTFPAKPGAGEPDSCANADLRSGPSAALPNCRAYEMVSPLDKNNSDIAPARKEVLDLARPDGEAITYAALSAFADPEGGSLVSQYIARRDSEEGWLSESINSRRSSASLYFIGGTHSPYKAFGEDLCGAWMLQDSDVALVEGAPEGFPGLYRRENCGAAAGQWSLLSTTTPPGFDPAAEAFFSQYSLEMQGFTADEQTSFFRAPAALSPAACASPAQGKDIFQLYASGGAPGEIPTLVSVLPGGAAACTHSSLGTAAGPERAFRQSAVAGAVSGDGARIYWSATEGNKALEQTTGPGRIYLRANPLGEGAECAEAASPCTRKVSEQISAEPARFWGASADGSVALFSFGPLNDGTGSLYEYDAETDEASLVAEGFKGVAGASEDGSRVYLVSVKDLDGAGPAQEGEGNLYLREEGEFTLVAALLAGETSGSSDWPAPNQSRPDLRASRVSADGAQIVFMARNPELAEQTAGYDNTDLASGQSDAEVYLYDAGSEELICASCNPSGARPAGRNINVEASPYWAAARIPGWTSQLDPSRVLSADGDRLFFESFEALVPRDTNGLADVYQWERVEAPGAAGREECERDLGGELYVPASSGCLSLISSGGGSQDAEFVDASASGDDVFFLTGADLVETDTEFIDLYDARVGGGFPPPPEPEPECEGDACQSPAPAPQADLPASSTYQGPGNLSQAPQNRCARQARRARRATGHARRARRAARRAHGAKPTRALRRRARARALRAKRLRTTTRRCRARQSKQRARANRRAER